MIQWLYPDKPTRTHHAALQFFNQDDYTALSKLDGWSCMIEFTDNIEFKSRIGKPLPVGEKILQACKNLYNSGKIPPNSRLWGEWMKLRPDYEGPECIYVFSPIHLAGEFVGHLHHKARFEWVDSLGLPIDDIQKINDDQMEDNPLVVPARSNNIIDFFEEMKKIRRTEGIVLYKNSGTIYGNTKSSVKNDTMIKCKYRDGCDGRTHVA